MGKIKLCHITESTTGGVWTHINQLAQHLDSNLFEQEFIVSTKKNPYLACLNDLHGHPMYHVDMERSIRPLQDTLAMLKIYSFLRTKKYDIVHCHSSKAGAIGRVAAKMAGISNVIYSPHAFSFFNRQSFFKNWIYITIEKILSQLSETIICVSEGEKELAVQAGLPSQRMTCIPNGIQVWDPSYNANTRTAFLQEWGLPSNIILIGFVGRLAEQKNPQLLLKALTELPDYAAVCFIGDGPLMKLMRDECATYGLQKRALFLGNREDVAELLAMLDLFVSTSNWEGLPYSILEAMSTRIPVVLSNIHGHREMVNHGVEGLLFEPGQVEDLVRQIQFALSNREKVKEMAKHALAKINEKYSLAAMIRSYEQLYRGMV